jgi:hypothetical protein
MRTSALLLSLLVLSAVLAGCSGSKPAAPAAAPAVELPVPAFAEPVPMPQVGGGEPNIAVTPDGTLFVASPAGLSKPNVQQGGAFLWRSRDGGATWQTLREPYVVQQQEGQAAPPGPFCSCDADVVVGPDGWVYYADWWIAGLVGPGQYIVEASPDGGDTWTSNPATIPENIVAAVDREWLVAGPDGFVGLFYSFFASTPVASLPVPAAGLDRPGQAIEAVFSTDHGQSWSTPVPVVPAGSDVAYQIGHPFLAPNGTLMMPYGLVHTSGNDFWYDESEVRLASSTDHGATWKDALLAEAPLGFDNLWAVQGAVDASTGETTVVWAARDSGVTHGSDVSADSTMGLWVKQFGPLGDRAPFLVRGAGQNFLPWATARGGVAAVGWYGGDATGDMTRAKPDAKWYAYAATAPDGLFRPGNLTVAPVSAEPVKTGPICPKGSACGGDRELLDYVSLVLDGQGLLHYTYTKSESGNAHVHVAGQTA